MRRFLLLIVCLSTCFAGVVPAAEAAAPVTPLGGRAWQVPVIRLYDSTPRLYREGIDIAIREWNAANVGIRFARTTNRARAHVVVGTARYPGQVAGMATLGQTRGAWIRLDTALVRTEHDERNGIVFDTAGYAIPEEIADVMAHEMGHVLGLEHTRGCTLMTGTWRDTCRDIRPEGQWSCRLIEAMDLRAAGRRYGGRGVLKAQRYCPFSRTPAGRVGAITSLAATRTYATKLTWRDVTNNFGYVVTRSAANAPCAASPDSGAKRFDLDFADFTDRWDDGPPSLVPMDATYCYSIWSRNGRGTLTGPTTKQVVVDAPNPSPVTAVSATVADATFQSATVAVSWANPANTTMAQVYQYPADGSCAVPASRAVAATSGSEPTVSVGNVQNGTWTFAVVRSSDPEDPEDHDRFIDFPSPPACTTISVALPAFAPEE